MQLQGLVITATVWFPISVL